MYLHMHIYTHIYIHVQHGIYRTKGTTKCTWTSTCVLSLKVLKTTHANWRSWNYVYVYVYVYIHIYTCAHTHIHIFIYIYTYVYIQYVKQETCWHEANLKLQDFNFLKNNYIPQRGSSSVISPTDTAGSPNETSADHWKAFRRQPSILAVACCS